MSYAVSSFCGSRATAFRSQAGVRRQQQVRVVLGALRDEEVAERGRD